MIIADGHPKLTLLGIGCFGRKDGRAAILLGLRVRVIGDVLLPFIFKIGIVLIS